MQTKEEKKEYNAAYYAANREKMHEQQKTYRASNVEEIKAQRQAYYAANRGEINARARVYYAANTEEKKAYRAAYYGANTEEILASERMRRYGVSPEDFQRMILVQKNTCGICKETFSKTPHVDHCHKTGEIRGLLCSGCNLALGGFKDSPKRLKSALEYLEHGPKN